MQDAQTAFSQCVRVLKPKGILHLLVKARTGNEKTAIVKDNKSLHERFFRYYDPHDIEELASANHLSMILLETYNEKDRGPDGRAEILWIHALMEKN
jgi:ubiquinone/menaquinone biosynthesis C-methylase UbiE